MHSRLRLWSVLFTGKHDVQADASVITLINLLLEQWRRRPHALNSSAVGLAFAMCISKSINPDFPMHAHL
jgi:hypothetical protein